MYTILFILFLLVFGYCVFSVLYIFLFSLAGRFFYRARPLAPAITNRRFAILVPAFREDTIILSTARNLLLLDYPKDAFTIFILADTFQPSTIAELKKLPIEVFEVSFEKSTKTKSLNEAFRRITERFDLALICDADNMLERDFLSKVNRMFESGYRAVQGRRVAKNLDSSFAVLDACSEAINNHIFRKGANALGLSSSIIGSGMVFEYDMLKRILFEVSAVGGFDKILQLRIIREGISIRYLENGLVYDEKVESPHAFKQQRKRWVSSQFIYFRQFLVPAFGQLFKGNFSYFNIAVLSNLILPRAFLFVLLPTLVVAGFLFGLTWGLAALGLGILYFIGMAMALPSSLVNKDLWSAVLKLPKAIGIMFGTLLHIRKANKTFIHTVHTKTEVQNPHALSPEKKK